LAFRLEQGIQVVKVEDQALQAIVQDILHLVAFQVAEKAGPGSAAWEACLAVLVAGRDSHTMAVLQVQVAFDWKSLVAIVTHLDLVQENLAMGEDQDRKEIDLDILTMVAFQDAEEAVSHSETQEEDHQDPKAFDLGIPTLVAFQDVELNSA
jgi:hypothetical protein